MHFKANPEKMESESEYQEVPKKDVVGKLVKGRKNLHRVWKQAAGRRGEPKERTWENCRSWSKLAAAGMRMTRNAKVTRGREHGLQRQGKDDISPRTWKGRTEENRRWKGLECNNVKRDRSLRQQLRGSKRTEDLGDRRPLHLRKERTTTNGIGWWSSGQRSHLGSGGTRKKTLYEIFRRKIAKQAVGTSSRLRRMMGWTLWKVWTTPKHKKAVLA
jgi:hypothetical protein